MRPAKVLVAQTGHLGDVVLGTPVYALLARHWPQARVSALVRAENAAVLEGQPYLDAVYTDDRRGSGRGLAGLLGAARRLREGRFDLAFGIHLSMRTALLLALARIPRRVGFRQSEGWFLYTDVASRDRDLHDTDRQCSLLGAAGVPWERGARPRLIVGSTAARRAERLLRARGLSPGESYVVLAPTSAWEAKQWVASGYAAVAGQLREMGERVVLVGAAGEGVTARRIVELAGDAIDVVGQTDTGVLAAVIAGAEALVSNDTAPQHIAQGAGVPVVSVFGPTGPTLGFAPRHAPAALVEAHPECRPQCRYGGLPCPYGTYECMERIRPERVLAALASVRAAAAPEKRRAG